MMRTTLRLDDDVLVSARVLARQTLSRPAGNGSQNDGARRSGLPQLPVKASGGVVDQELVNQLRYEEAR